MSTIKPFSQLTAAGQKKRLAKYAAQRAQYGNLNGLFRVVKIKDHGERDTKNGKVHAYGYRVVPAGEKNNEEGIKNGTFLWMNEMVNLKGKSQIAIDVRNGWIEKLNNGAKSILVSIDYKPSEDGKYRDVRSIYERTAHKKATAAPAVQDSSDAMPM